MPEPADILDPAPQGQTSGTPLLQARDLCFDAGGKRLLNTVDLTISAGRRTVVMGANGAGKSLLLRLLHGLLRPAAGEVLWRGHPLDSRSRHRQAMVFQRPVMLRRSVLANLRFVLAARGIGRPERDHLEKTALERAQLSDMVKQPARLLSVGEQQRLAVARALSCSPEVLFLDEPTASLDPVSTHVIEQLILEASHKGVTCVIVTHDAGQARRLGQDALFMHGGRLVEANTVGSLLESPRSEAARLWLAGQMFLGTSAAICDSSQPGDTT